MERERRIRIAADADIVLARQEGRALASTLTFSPTDLTVIASAISEVARNIYKYAGTGEIHVAIVEQNGRRGVRITATDEGPGIADVELALEDGYSTSGSLGLGLPGARRLMDELVIETSRDSGTRVTMWKWAR